MSPQMQLNADQAAEPRLSQVLSLTRSAKNPFLRLDIVCLNSRARRRCSIIIIYCSRTKETVSNQTKSYTAAPHLNPSKKLDFQLSSISLLPHYHG